MKSASWDFIVKAIEYLDDKLGEEYIAPPITLLWKIVRESYHCSNFAMKFLVPRLLKVRRR
jgi:hypothetical protein